MKKISILLVVFISILFAQSAFAQFAGGDGSSGSPYQITNGAQLDSIRYYLSSYFILNNDISLSAFQSGTGWDPIDNFTGNLNGNGKKITDLKINTTAAYTGLFGSGISGATISNLGLDNVDIVTTGTTCGGLIATASGTVTISKCYVTGTISGNNWMGGLIGTTQVAGSSISNCYSRASVTGTGSGIGGLIGYYTVDASTTLNYCYSTGAVSTTGSKGGLIANVDGTGFNATACFWDTLSSGLVTSAGGAGVVGEGTTEMQTQSTFTDAGWDFTTIWKIVGANYPTLKVMSAPDIDISAASISFGVVPVSTVKKDSILVSNAGIDTLYITGISSSNGRFTVAPTTMTLAASASAYLVVTFTPADSSSQSGSIVLTHNAAGSPDTVAVSGKGSIAPGISISASSINFGSVQVSTEKKDSVLISSTGTDTLRITGISSSNARFTLSPATMTLAPSAGRYLVVTFTPADTNNQSGLIILTHNEAGSPDTVTVSGKGSPAPAPQFSVSASSINFGSTAIGVGKKDSVLVTNTGNDTLKVTGISSSNARFTISPATMTLAPSANSYLVVTFTPADTNNQAGSIVLTHDAAGSPDTVAVSGKGSFGPVITFSADSINFGTIQIGTAKKDSILVSNTGIDTLKVTGISSSNARFAVSPAAITLAPSASSYLVVTFTPADVNNQSGSVILTHNAAGLADTIGVSGKGSIAPAPEISFSKSDINFGIVKIGFEKKDSILVTNVGTATLVVTNISSANTSFTVTPATMTLAPLGTRYLVVTFAPVDTNDQSGSIVLTHNAAGFTSTITVNGKGSLESVPWLSLSAASINFGTVQVGSSKKDSILVSNTGYDTLKITGISSTFARFTFTPAAMTLVPSANRYLVVTFTPADTNSQSGSIILTHNALGSPDTVAVWGKGNPAPAPKISISAASINFGTVQVGSEKKDSILISNIGTETLRITGISSTNARFTFEPATMALAPSDNSYLIVTFTPADANDQSGSIILTHNAEGSPDTVTVSGNGGATVGVNEITGLIPNEFRLEQNYPNPFNPATTITYSIPGPGFVSIVVYDVLGRRIQTLVEKHQAANYYSVKFNAHNLQSGVYFIRINVTDDAGVLRFSKTNKMLLTK